MPDVCQQLAEGIKVKGQWHIGVSIGTKQNESEPIALAAFDELADDKLKYFDAAGGLGIDGHVRLIHAARDIDREHQIATTHRARYRVAEPEWPAGGEYQANPENPQQQTLSATRRSTGRLCGDLLSL